MVLPRAGDSESLGVYDWPIMWCPNAAYHEQDTFGGRQASSCTGHDRTPSPIETQAALPRGCS